MTKHIITFFTILLMLLSSAKMQAQAWLGKTNDNPTERKELKYGPLQQGKRTDSDMQRFREYGLGQFIHWGVYAIAGGEWKGAKTNQATEWIRAWSGPSKPDNWKSTYDNLYKQFNPKNFDAKRWARQAKKMGAKYMIITTKHHDGFCLWPSRYSDYTIQQTPYKKDIVKELVDAYTAAGIDVYLYFSIIDWHHKGYRSAPAKTETDKKSYQQFLQYTRNQLFELMNNYPKMKGFWFDGTWDKSWVNQAAWTYQLEKDLRAAHPGLIIGSRFRNDEFGKRHFDSNGDLLGDYEQGWERKLPAKYELLQGNDWDCVMTIPPGDWGYRKDWSGSYIKTSYDLIKMVMHCNSMGGNLVLNFGPDAKGNIRAEESKLATEIGNWMKINGEAVYGVRHADLDPTKYGYYTQKDSVLYLTVFNRPVNNLLQVKIADSATRIPVKAFLLQGNQPLQMKLTDMGLDRDHHVYYNITVPKTFKSELPFVIKIQTTRKVRKKSTQSKAHI